MASTSVRGTRFSVQTDATGRTIAAVDEGAVAVATIDAAKSRRRGAAPDLVLTAGHGLASAPLVAPDVTGRPERFEDAYWLDIALPAIASASRYPLQVARDAQMKTPTAKRPRVL